LSLQSDDDLNSVDELYTEGDFRQLVMTVETAPASLSGLFRAQLVFILERLLFFNIMNIPRTWQLKKSTFSPYV
jgi:hypothetical protein